MPTNQTTQTQPEHKKGPKPEPAVLPGQASEFAGVAEPAGQVLGANGNGNVESQAARLNDARFQTAQRQGMARQIVHVQGNYHLQRAIHTTTHTSKSNGNGHKGNGNGSASAGAESYTDEPVETFEAMDFGELEAVSNAPPDNPNSNNQNDSHPVSLFIQRKPSEYEHPEDGSNVEQRMQQHIREEEEEGEEPEEGTSPEEAAKNVDRGKVAAKKGEVREDTEPDVDRPVEEKSLVEQNAQETKKATEEAAEPLAEGEAKEPPKEKQAGDQAANAAQQAAAMAEQAFAEAESQPEPEAPPMETTLPEPVAPVDAGGTPLPGDPAAEAQVADLAQQAQRLKMGGHGLRQQAALHRTNAMTIQGNIGLVAEGIGQSEQGVEKSTSHLEFRQGVVDQAQSALELSEQKADMVAKEAPEYAAKSDEGKEESGPMVSEAGEMAGENAAHTPDDEEAAGDSQEQGEKINKVGSDASNMDNAIAQTKERAGSLGEEAAQAKETNAQSAEKINSAKQTLDQTQQRLDQMGQQNAQARSQVEALASQPAAMIMQANELDQRGQSLDQSSDDILRRLTQVQTDYQAGMSAVPAVEEAESAGEEGPPIQRQPEEESAGQATALAEAPAPDEEMTEAPAELSADGQSPSGDERINVDLAGGLQESLPAWATGADEPSQEQRQQAIQAQEERRAQQLQAINDAAGGNFESLSAGDKMGLALQMTGENLFSSVSDIQWPGWGKLAAGIIDPRGPMMGVVGGLSKMLSGGANLLSAEQWARDPVGNLLKSAADIATGLTIVLGSITALAGVIIAIMTAITICSFGFAAPVTGPIIAFCATVLTTVGGWTIAVGKIALILQALVLIKNLIDAATAQSAQELLSESEQMTENVKDAGGVVLQMGMAKLGQIGGRGLKAQIAQAGGPTAFARAMPGQMVASARALPGRAAAGARAAGGSVATGARAVGRGVRTGLGRAWEGAGKLGRRAKNWFGRRFGRRRAGTDRGLADRGYRPRPGERTMTREQWRAQHRAERNARPGLETRGRRPAPGERTMTREQWRAQHRAERNARPGLETRGRRPAPGERTMTRDQWLAQEQARRLNERLYSDPGGLAHGRSRALQQALPPNQRGRVTMSAGVVEDANGVRRVVIATSEPRGYLRPGVGSAVQPNEIVIPGTGHAEADIVNWAHANGYRPITVGAGRPHCPPCVNVIEGAGATTASPRR